MQPHQILDLQEYLLIIRPKILAERMRERSGRKPDQCMPVEEAKRLFITMNGQEGIKATKLHLNYALRKVYPKYKHAKKIRRSVIREWLRDKNLRVLLKGSLDRQYSFFKLGLQHPFSQGDQRLGIFKRKIFTNNVSCRICRSRA